MRLYQATEVVLEDHTLQPLPRSLHGLQQTMPPMPPEFWLDITSLHILHVTRIVKEESNISDLQLQCYCNAELNSEQKALLDFLVLAQGSAFVGFGSSTFSFYLREFRSLAGIPRSTSVLVDASVIGTDPLFNSAGTVV